MQIANFELTVSAVDFPTDRRRWNGGPFPSQEAHEALIEAVESFKDSLRSNGFVVAHSDYGVFATEVDLQAQTD